MKPFYFMPWLLLLLGIGVFGLAPGQTSPNEELRDLKEGNLRFVNGSMKSYDYSAQKEANKESQNPGTVVLSCMDSRGIPELTFDQGIGHLFVIRIAGNVVNDDILGSLEYATKVIGSKLIVVLGHTNCGAVQGACKKVDIGHIADLVRKIDPAVATARAKDPEGICDEQKFVDEIAHLNVEHSKKEIEERSPIIKELIKEGQVRIVGAMYNIHTGKVEFFE